MQNRGQDIPRRKTHKAQPPKYLLPRGSGQIILANATVGTIHDRFVDINITIPDLQVETAIRVGAHPSFVLNGRPLTAEIREGNKIAALAF